MLTEERLREMVMAAIKMGSYGSLNGVYADHYYVCRAVEVLLPVLEAAEVHVKQGGMANAQRLADAIAAARKVIGKEVQ